MPDQLKFDQWTTLLEPKPEKAKVAATAEVPTHNESPVSPESDAADKAKSSEPTVLSVSDLNSMIKEQIEGEFRSVWVQGEISNFKPHTSGHFYFSLKDDRSQISAVMFKGFNGKLKFRPENGMEVIVRGRVTVYEPRGNYQIFCETMEPVGAGALQKAFEQLKAKLQSEGLFNPEHKKALPFLPKRIGVVTSPTGAAIQDILNVLGRRCKSAHVTVIPARVQGEGAAQEVVRGIELANRIGNYDVLIVGRGGGSIEDMWCFNEEIVARAIYASQIPIISAVGHEIDFTIADFVADYRAPTPSAAAEVVAKSVSELSEKVLNHRQRLLKSVQFRLSQWLMRVNHYQSRLVDPKRRLEDLSLRCDEVFQRLQLAWQRHLRDQQMHIRLLRQKLRSPLEKIQRNQQKLANFEKILRRDVVQGVKTRKDVLFSLMAMLDSLSPLKVLGRGYAVVFRGEEIIKAAGDVKAGEELSLELAQSALKVKVVGPEPTRFKTMEEAQWTSKKN